MKGRTVLRFLAVVGAFGLAGCSIRQEVTPLSAPVQQVCIVENEAVREGVLTALQEAFANHRASTRVIPGTYTLQHKLLNPTWQPTDTTGCDALTFYTANWTWDLALYMVFANIWMTASDGSVKLAQATYDATSGGGRMSKFINANEKIHELVDQMYAGTSMLATATQPAPIPAQAVQAVPLTVQATPASPGLSLAPVEERLRALQRLHDEGLVNASEYEAKRQELLKEL